MLLVYLLIFLSPVAVILLVMFAIGVAAARTVRTGKRIFRDVKPLADDLKERATSAQQRGLSFADRGNGIAKSFEEIAGRWAFIGEAFQETKSSPLVKLAGMAGRYASDRGRD